MKITALSNLRLHRSCPFSLECLKMLMSDNGYDDNSIAVHTIMNFEREIELTGFN